MPAPGASVAPVLEGTTNVRGLRTSAVIAGVAAVALTLSACGSKSNGGGNTGANTGAPSQPAGGNSSSVTGSSSSTASGAGKTIEACMVLDTGGVDDHSFNQSSYAGMTAANKANPKIAISYAPSNSQNDYTPNLNAAVNKGCDTTVAVGGLMADAVKAVAAAIALFGFQSGAALATVVGVLVEVPVMLSVVAIVVRTRGWYERRGSTRARVPVHR